MINEYCPHCNKEVKIKCGFVKQECPECKLDMLPCSLCDTNEIDCRKCLA